MILSNQICLNTLLLQHTKEEDYFLVAVLVVMTAIIIIFLIAWSKLNKKNKDR